MFPHMRAARRSTELSEERRLAYVGITMARERLYLSRAKVLSRRVASRCSIRNRASCGRSHRSSSTGDATDSPASGFSAPMGNRGPVRHIRGTSPARNVGRA